MADACSIESLTAAHARPLADLATQIAAFEVVEDWRRGSREWIDEMVAEHHGGLGHAFVMTGAEAEVMGACFLRLPTRGARSASLGYWVGLPFRRRGVATAAGSQVLHFGFTVLGLEHTDAAVRVTNGASLRVLEKLGFIPIARADAREPHYFTELWLPRSQWEIGK